MSTIAAWFAAFPKMFGIKESFVDHSADQSHPPAKRGTAFHGTQLPRPSDHPTMPSTHPEQIKHFNHIPNADREIPAKNAFRGYAEQAHNSDGGHQPAYHHRHIKGLPH